MLSSVVLLLMPYYTVEVKATTSCYVRFEAKNLSQAMRKAKLNVLPFDQAEEQLNQCKPCDFELKVLPSKVELDTDQYNGPGDE